MKRRMRLGKVSTRGRLPILLLLLSCLLALAGCDKAGVKPHSVDAPYAVTLVGDHGNVVRNVLAQDMPGLPQRESQFNVTSVDATHFSQAQRYARNLVLVDINSAAHATVTMYKEQDIWARPQLVVHIGTPSARSLRLSTDSLAPTLLQWLNRSEIRHSLATLSNKRDTTTEKEIRQMFNCRMWIPSGMTVNKRSADFLWLSNNSHTDMRNIVIYRGQTTGKNSENRPYNHNEEAAKFIKARNHMLGINIKGETDAMQIETVAPSVTIEHVSTAEQNLKKGQRDDTAIIPHAITIYRGLWQMKGDDMGGPFVSRTLDMKREKTQGQENCTCIVIEGFIYAPGKKKRDSLRQLEALLYTACIDS